MIDTASILIVAVLVAGVVHAAWNALLATGSDQIATTRLLIMAQMAVGAVLLFLAKSTVNEIITRSWQWLIGSGVGNILYWYGLGQSYRNREFVPVYGVIRGSIPLFATAGALIFAGQWPTPLGWFGIALVSVGVCVLRFSGVPAGAAPAFLWGIVTAFGAAVSLGSDGLGMLQAQDRLGFFGCSLMIGGALALGAFGLARLAYAPLQGKEFLRGVIAGLLAAMVYGIGVWAASYHELGKISALRETSILFAVLIGWLFLHQSINAKRVVGCVVVTSGALALVLAR